MRNFFSHWRILLALVALIVLAILIFRSEEARAAPSLHQRIHQHVKAIASTDNHVESTLASHGYRIRRHDYKHHGYAVRSIEASRANVAPGARPERVFIVGGRYDPERDSHDGASDGAAAVLELARLLQNLRPAAGTEILFVLFAAPTHSAGDVDSANAATFAIGLPPPSPGSGNFIAFVGPRAAAAPVRQALASFRDDPRPLAAGIAAPCYEQLVTVASRAATRGSPALLVTDTAFTRYPYFSTKPQEPDYEDTARVVRGLARTLAALAGAPST